MPYPKLMVMVSYCWKMKFLPSNIKKQIRFIDDVLEINDQSRWILSGPPCINYDIRWDIVIKFSWEFYDSVFTVIENRQWNLKPESHTSQGVMTSLMLPKSHLPVAYGRHELEMRWTFITQLGRLWRILRMRDMYKLHTTDDARCEIVVKVWQLRILQLIFHSDREQTVLIPESHPFPAEWQSHPMYM